MSKSHFFALVPPCRYIVRPRNVGNDTHSRVTRPRDEYHKIWGFWGFYGIFGVFLAQAVALRVFCPLSRGGALSPFGACTPLVVYTQRTTLVAKRVIRKHRRIMMFGSVTISEHLMLVVEKRYVYRSGKLESVSVDLMDEFTGEVYASGFEAVKAILDFLENIHGNGCIGDYRVTHTCNRIVVGVVGEE